MHWCGEGGSKYLSSHHHSSTSMHSFFRLHKRSKEHRNVSQRNCGKADYHAIPSGVGEGIKARCIIFLSNDLEKADVP